MVGLEQHDRACLVGKAERQHLGPELVHLPRRNVDHGRHLSAEQRIRLVVLGDLRAANKFDFGAFFRMAAAANQLVSELAPR